MSDAVKAGIGVAVGLCCWYFFFPNAELMGTATQLGALFLIMRELQQNLREGSVMGTRRGKRRRRDAATRLLSRYGPLEQYAGRKEDAQPRRSSASIRSSGRPASFHQPGMA